MDCEKAIRDELGKAAGRLGAGAEVCEKIRSLACAELYRALEELGADRLLLAFVCAWSESSDDAGVLESLKQWNQNGDFRFVRLPGGAPAVRTRR
jgi:hypothetical protein